MATYAINQELNGIEITFSDKPAAETLTALKSAGYRWHRGKKLWYAKQTADRLKLAQELTDGITETAPKAPEQINLDGLGKNNPGYHDTDITAALREEFKRRGVKGVTVRAGRGGWTASITVTVKATADDMASVEEMRKRYPVWKLAHEIESRDQYIDGRYVSFTDWQTMSDEEKGATHRAHLIQSARRLDSVSFGGHYDTRETYFEMTTDFYNKVEAVYKIANQWNYDNSDLMTDYFDVGYYLHISIKKPADFTPREDMTDAERKAYADEIRRKEEEEAAARARWEKEEAERKEADRKREEERKAARELIDNNITVTDLEKPVYITSLVGGIGKESTLEELEETINERPHTSDAVITRKVTFATREAYEAFGGLLIDDFSFLEGKGGTGSNDIRLEGVENLYRLTREQRDTVKWIMCDCVAIYCEDKLELVCNPEGYSYSRYTYRPTADSTTSDAETVEQEQREASKALPPFYFPAPVTEQAAKLEAGQAITVYQSDGWNLCDVYDGAGIIKNVHEGTWAQYSGVYIEFTTGKQSFIRDGKDCLIYEGIKPRLPVTVTTNRISETMSELLKSDDLFPRILAYYEDEKPLIDTIQR